MPRKDHHSEPYDPGSLLKLALFESYIQSWLPVFVHLKYIHTINFFDFYCGPGQDIKGKKGSPLRTLDVIHEHESEIRENNKTVSAFFSDNTCPKIDVLENVLSQLVKDKPYLNVTVKCAPFEKRFQELLPIMTRQHTANFIFIDPSGFAVTPDIFKTLTHLKFTDFLLFIPSSFAHRFKSDPTVASYFPGLTYDDNLDSNKRHAVLAQYYRDHLLQQKPYYLAPFSIKKKPNLYGLIFGSNHILGLDKFIRACWAADPDNGDLGIGFEADFPDVPHQGNLLNGENASPKRLALKSYLKSCILNGQIQTNHDIYEMTLMKACLPKHAKKILRDLKNEGIIINVPNVGSKIMKQPPIRIEVAS